MDAGLLDLTSSEPQMDLMNMMAYMEKLGQQQQQPPTTLQPPPILSPAYDSAASSCYPSQYAAAAAREAAMREMVFRMAAMQPVHIDLASVKLPKRRNVRMSKEPQSVAARHRRERISEKIRILQRLVPGGTKMDTASMLDEAIHYVKFLKTQVQSLERVAAAAINSGSLGFMNPHAHTGIGLMRASAAAANYSCFGNNNVSGNNSYPIDEC